MIRKRMAKRRPQEMAETRRHSMRRATTYISLDYTRRVGNPNLTLSNAAGSRKGVPRMNECFKSE